MCSPQAAGATSPGDGVVIGGEIDCIIIYMELSRAEYYQAHRFRLEAIANKVGEHLTTASYPIVATMEPGDESAFLISGLETPDAIAAQYRDNGTELPEESAQELADLYNWRAGSTAAIAIRSLIAGASMDGLAKHIGAHPSDPHNPWDTPDNPVAPYVPFTKASYIAADWRLEEGEKVTLATATLEGLDHVSGDVAQQHTVTLEDEYTQRSFSLMSVKGEVSNTNYKIVPKEDALLRRCVALLGSNVADIFSMLAGQFEDEDELDSALNDVWIAHQSQATEEEIGPLLEEVRLRALAVKHSHELNATHDLSLPAADNLYEIEQLLGRLV